MSNGEIRNSFADVSDEELVNLFKKSDSIEDTLFASMLIREVLSRGDSKNIKLIEIRDKLLGLSK